MISFGECSSAYLSIPKKQTFSKKKSTSSHDEAFREGGGNPPDIFHAKVSHFPRHFPY
jgi:hypothetical protein